MAGTLVANTINTDTGLFSTQNAYQGIAKAWVNFAGNNPAVNNASFNVSSITRTAGGQFTIAFTTALSSSSYSSVIGMSPASLTAGFNNVAVITPSGASTTQLQISTGYNLGGSQAYVDGQIISVAIFSA